MIKSSMLRELADRLPDSVGKEQLLSQLAKKKPADGLNDEYNLQASGHIKIETIDEEGEATGVVLEKSNLVVDGADAILLRAFAGDTERILYRNRTIKAASGVSAKYHIRRDRLTDVVNGANILALNPNEYWSAVEEADFDTEYAYAPVSLFLKEETSTEPGMLAFSVSKTFVTGSIPLPAEIYSGYSNYFIGLGDGVRKQVLLDDPRLAYTGFTNANGNKKSTTVGSKLVFEQKISNFGLNLQKSNKGGQLEIRVNGVVDRVVETFNSNLADGATEDLLVELDGIDLDVLTKIELVFTGADSGITSPEIVITGFGWDALQKKDNGLIREFKNFETRFDTQEIYNTLPTPDANGHYAFRLLNYPAKVGTVKVQYDGLALAEVQTKSAVVSGKFFVDHIRGFVYFADALTGLAVTFETSGEILEDEREAALGSASQSTVIAREKVAGTIDGTNKIFTTPSYVSGNGSIGSFKLYVDGTIISTSLYSQSGGTITFNTAPAATAVVEYEATITYTVRKYTLLSAPTNEVVTVIDATNAEFVKATRPEKLAQPGFYMINPQNPLEVFVSAKTPSGGVMTNLEFKYASVARPGVPTGYKRSVILKPKKMNEYPWFALDRGEVTFVGEFKENTPGQAVTIREMGLFDGPRLDDGIRGFKNYPVSAFSLIRVPKARKDTKTGMRITWTITLADENGVPFKG